MTARLELANTHREERIVNYLDFDRELIRQHNGELLREARAQRLGRQLRTNSSRPRSGRSHTLTHILNLSWRSVLSLVRGVASSE